MKLLIKVRRATLAQSVVVNVALYHIVVSEGSVFAHFHHSTAHEVRQVMNSNFLFSLNLREEKQLTI